MGDSIICHGTYTNDTDSLDLDIDLTSIATGNLTEHILNHRIDGVLNGKLKISGTHNEPDFSLDSKIDSLQYKNLAASQIDLSLKKDNRLEGKIFAWDSEFINRKLGNLDLSFQGIEENKIKFLSFFYIRRIYMMEKLPES